MAAAGSLKIEIKKSFLTKSSGGKSFRGNFYWKSRFFKLEAEFPINSFPGPGTIRITEQTLSAGYSNDE
jgi:hypothetical protein